MRYISSCILFYLVLAVSIVNASKGVKTREFSILNMSNNAASTINYIGGADFKPQYNRLELCIDDPSSKSVHCYLFLTSKNNVAGFDEDSSNCKFLRYDFKGKLGDNTGNLFATLFVARPLPIKVSTRIITSTSAFLFLRKDKPVALSISDLSLAIPGLEFPVGGITLVPLSKNQDVQESEIIIGNDKKITNIDPHCGSCRNSVAKSINKQPYNECKPGQAEWDLVFAWQPSAFPAVPTFDTTHEHTHSHLNEKGFFATVESQTGTNRGNTLNQSPSYMDVNNAWTLGWSVDGTTDRLVKLGLSEKLIPVGKGKFKVGGYLMGAMHPKAEVAWYRDEGTDNADTINGKSVNLAVLTGTNLPMIARDGEGGMIGQFGQLIVTGRTFWLKNNHWGGNLLLHSDQYLSEDESSRRANCPRRYGTTVTFVTYLPIR